MLRKGVLYTAAGTTLVLGGYVAWKAWAKRQEEVAAAAAADDGRGSSGGGGRAKAD
jgi:predicted negative regulator of RcsB-dependent stress response